MQKQAIARVISAYDDAVVRAYARGRFQILRQRFLDEIGQYLPPSGRVLDIGCGFGLFALYYAQLHPGLRIEGVEINPSRVAMAEQARSRLGVSNATFRVGDASQFRASEPYDAVYLLDIVHHIPPGAVPVLLEQLHAVVRPGSRVLVKEVDTLPAYKRWFTYLLDRLMDPKGTVHYWSQARLRSALQEAGFEVFVHTMVDYLPYPHVLYVCRRGVGQAGAGPTPPGENICSLGGQGYNP